MSKVTKLNNKKKLPWGEEEQKVFDETKSVISHVVILSCHGHSQGFELHSGASDTQLGGYYVKMNKPVAFYTKRKRNAFSR